MSYVASTRLRADPFALAADIGIAIRFVFDVPFGVGSVPGVILVKWDQDPVVQRDRVWRGIAQCLLTASGVDWEPGQAVEVAARISRASARIS